jgi:hypothetical protein
MSLALSAPDGVRCLCECVDEGNTYDLRSYEVLRPSILVSREVGS